MGVKVSRNLHVPLPEGLHDRLRSEAARARRPATVVAREAIEAWVEQREREALHDAVATYACAVAGSRADLDEDLEQAGIEHLIGGRRRRR
jgi:predicted DNA-binding protein